MSTRVKFRRLLPNKNYIPGKTMSLPAFIRENDHLYKQQRAATMKDNLDSVLERVAERLLSSRTKAHLIKILSVPADCTISEGMLMTVVSCENEYVKLVQNRVLTCAKEQGLSFVFGDDNHIFLSAREYDILDDFDLSRNSVTRTNKRRQCPCGNRPMDPVEELRLDFHSPFYRNPDAGRRR